MCASKTALITGCSTGLGRATALHLARHGWRVFATLRKQPDAASLSAEAETQGCAEGLSPLLCDITIPEQIAALPQAVSAITERLDALVNNAGTAYPAPLELLPPAELRAQYEINVIGHVAVTQALLPFLKRAGGTIINVSSVSGRLTSPGLGAYSSSKFALEALSDALRVELAPFGVRVVVIEPGPSPTEIWDTSRHRALDKMEELGVRLGAYAPLLDTLERGALKRARRGFPPERFAKLVLSILEQPNPRPRYAIPRHLGFLFLVRRLVPDRLWDRLVRWQLDW